MWPLLEEKQQWQASWGEKEDLEEREKIHVSTQLLTSLQAPNTTWLSATASSQLFGPDQSQGKSWHLTWKSGLTPILGFLESDPKR